MRRLEYHFSCLDGSYFLLCEISDKVCFTIETDIEGFESRNGELAEEETAKFVKLLDEAQIEKWERDYSGSDIEDAISWKLKYVNEDKEYVSKGEETLEPYEYEKLIEALKLVEKKADFFKAQVNE